MKPIRPSVVTGATAMLLCFAAILPAEALDIVRDGQATATIVIAEDAGVFQKAAATYVRDYVQQSTGARLNIVRDSGNLGGTLISIGHNRLSEEANIRTDELKWDGCRLIVRGPVVYLIGRDAKPLSGIRSAGSLRGAGAQGTAKAATIFVEDYVGVRWFLPTAEGIYVPARQSIRVPDDLDRTFTPSFAYTAVSIQYPRPLDNIAMNQREAIKFRSYGGHSWYEAVPVEKYFDAHPEYFRMNESGQRVADGNHLCTSNREVRQIVLASVRVDFDAGYDIVQLGQSDGWTACLCEECMKLDNHTSHETVTLDNPCRKIWDMHQWIIDQCRQSHPNKKLRVMIYGPTWAPPRDWTTLRDNVIGEIAPMTEERIAAWDGRLAGIAVWSYWWHANTLPTVFVPATPPQFLQQRLRAFRDLKAVGMVGDPQGQWGLGGPSHYVFCKLIGDVDTNVAALVDDYCQCVFGEAGWIMQRFFKLLHERMALTIPLKEMRWSKESRGSGCTAEEAFMFLYPPKVVNQLERLLRRAEAAANSPRAKAWLKLTRDEFDGLKAVVNMFVHKRAFETAPTRERLVAVRQAVDRFESWRKSILFYPPEHTERWFPDHNELCAILLTDGRNLTSDYRDPAGAPSYYRFHYIGSYTRLEIEAIRAGKKRVHGRAIGSGLGNRAIRAPITWDFDAMAASLGQPEEIMQIVAEPVKQPFVLDGRLDPEQWQDATPVALQQYQAAGSKVSSGATTTVRVKYDKSHLYVRYDCAEPAIDAMKLTSVGRDGKVWGNDEVELFLNTDLASDRKVMQFMVSPIEDAFYDARTGFVDDPLHPEYDKWEITTWNPDWRRGFSIDGKAGRWTMELALPFNSLRAAPPSPGTAWTCNFARCRRAQGEELSSWIPDTFGKDPKLFGELLFGGTPSSSSGAAPTTRWAQPVHPSETTDKGSLLRNGDFEAVTIDGVPEVWQINSYPQPGVRALTDHCFATRDNPHGGQRALRIDFTAVDFEEAGDGHTITFNQSISASRVAKLRGKKVKLTFWIRYDELSEETREYYFPGPALSIRCWDSDNKLLSGPPAFVLHHKYLEQSGLLAAFDAAPRWVKLEREGSVPEAAARMDFHGSAVGRSRHSGKLNHTAALIDDIRLEVVQ